MQAWTAWSYKKMKHTKIKAYVIFKLFLKCVRDMITTYSQMHLTDKYSQHSSIIWPIWPNGWVVVYDLSGCGFDSRCIYLNLIYRACFEQGVPWHSDKYRVWIHSQMRYVTW